MLECRPDRHFVNLVYRNDKYADARTNPVLDKWIQSGNGGILWYRTEIPDAGILMTAASAMIPMPIFAN
jgi:hypothetical protein